MGRSATLVSHAVVGWTICGGTIAVGRLALSTPTALITHAIVAPIVFAVLSLHIFQNDPAAPPLRTSLVMVGIVMGLDGLVVAPFIEQSYAMFASALGMGIPFGLISLTSFLTGHARRRRLPARS